MSGEVQASRLGDGLKNTAHVLVEDILASGLSKADARYEAASNLVIRAAWKGYWLRLEENPKFEATEMTANEFCDFLSEMEGRVLTVLEGVFPAGQQCEALKSLARQEVWETRKRIGIAE